MGTIAMLTQFYPPDIGGAASRTAEIASFLQRSGHSVTVVTPYPYYPHGRIPRRLWFRPLTIETQRGIRIIRVPILGLPSRGFKNRVLLTVTFALTSLIAVPFALKSRILYIRSPEMILGLVWGPIIRLTGKRVFLDVTDVLLEYSDAVGLRSGSLLVRLSKFLQKLPYYLAREIFSVSNVQRRLLVAAGAPSGKIKVIPQGVNLSEFNINLPPDESYLTSLGISGKFVVLYSGIMGRMQQLDQLLETARLISSHAGIVFLLVGDGESREDLKRTARSYGLTNVVFAEPVQRETMPGIIRASDVCCVILSELGSRIGARPRKLYEYMACGKPVLAVDNNETKAMLARSGGGLAVNPGNCEGLASALMEIYSGKIDGKSMGRRGFEYISKFHTADAMYASLSEEIS